MKNELCGPHGTEELSTESGRMPSVFKHQQPCPGARAEDSAWASCVVLLFRSRDFSGCIDTIGWGVASNKSDETVILTDMVFWPVEVKPRRGMSAREEFPETGKENWRVLDPVLFL
jgi:hypothetical protein